MTYLNLNTKEFQFKRDGFLHSLLNLFWNSCGGGLGSAGGEPEVADVEKSLNYKELVSHI
jgi:hypothetical protein